MTKLSIAAGAAADHRDLPPQLQHSFHQGHSLKLVPNNDGVKFKCDGCKRPGTGARYECEHSAEGRCTLDLHIRCALAPDVREIGGHWFAFLLEPLPGEGRTFCDACGYAATGFVYHCPDLEHDVHPCCAGLPSTFDLAGLSFELRIKDDAPQRRCALCAEMTKCKCKCGSRRCGANRACWSYRSVDDDLFLHVACVVRDLACDDSFTIVSLGKAMAARASETWTGSVVVNASRVYHGDHQEMVLVKEAALRALLLKGQGRGDKGRRGALERSLRVLGFIVRVVIGVIFGDPTAMIVAVGHALSGG